MTVKSNQHSVLLENVYQFIRKKVDGSQSPLVEQFARSLYQNIPEQDLQQRNEGDLYGAALSLWNEFWKFDASEPTIRVFNPDLDRSGWQSTHTIVEIIIADMPFLVDSVRMALNRAGYTAHLLLHEPISVIRNQEHEVLSFESPDSKAKQLVKNTVFLIEIDRLVNSASLAELVAELHSVVKEVSLAVVDWEPMRAAVNRVIEHCENSALPCGDDRKKDVLKFMQWVRNHNFTLMGYRSYSVTAIEGDHQWSPDDETSLGLMKNSKGDRVRLLSEMPQGARDLALGDDPIMFTKTHSRSRVHRPAYMDYIGLKRFDDKGNVVGEDRFIGLYSASFYNASIMQIPILQRKIARICQQTGFEKGSHAYKAVLNILETYPRDELLQGWDSDLLKIVVGMFNMQERGMSRLFVRQDIFGRYHSCMVFVPRERYNTQLRKDTQALLQKSFGSDKDIEFTTYFSESVYARTQYMVRGGKNEAEVNVKEIENNVIELTKSWDDKLSTAIRSSYGEAKGKGLEQKYANAFAPSYKERNLPSVSVVDIEKLELLDENHTLDMLFYRPQEERSDSDAVRLKLFHKNEPIHLSVVLPMLENFGLRVIAESPYQVRTHNGEVNWIMDFSMLHSTGGTMNMKQAMTLFQEAFSQVWTGYLEDDAFNRLVLGAGLTGRRVTILRAYAKYLRQTGSSFSNNYVAYTLDRYPTIAKLIVDLFEHRFNPQSKQDINQQDQLVGAIKQALEQVANLDDDRIIRRYLDMILATFRTNFYQPDPQGHAKSYVSFKFQPELIPEMPLPLPKYEIFVYSPRVEGVHLRGGKVARGGLRWSDRREDFRTEVLGLVKAQQVKNTVIVPVGAKGGFVCKKLHEKTERGQILEEGKACYRIFIRSLLDITDNIVDGKIVHPENVVRHDEDDAYLVVAADKGTATFSDIANEISNEYHHWLGDAFASGGSVGYDHKGMGITARGAWEGVKRHFREIGINCQTTDFTCLAVGDMAGDVFGNGMLLSKHIRLMCAFNHMHIFFDPSPDANSSFAERQRLFDNPSLTWADYDPSLLSKGGGIFSRSAKSIALSNEMKKCLGTKKATMTPNELIHTALKMSVDLIWNGGIGTYIKSSKETHADCGDRANDDVRVNGKDVKAKIIGEGGNLGLTQLGRVEFSSHGGRCNSDFIDNVGGVDCSDNEVNIKILLNSLVSSGDLTTKQRNELLYDMTDDVAELVLLDCYRQTQSISITHLGGPGVLKEQIRFIHALEREGYLNRELEFIPSDDELSERSAKGLGLTRPELSVLIAYGKMVLKEKLNIVELTNNPYHSQLLLTAFPKILQDKFAEHMDDHPLRAEIIATKLANNMINDMGLNFLFRIQEETGATVPEIANAYAVVKGVFNHHGLWEAIEKLDNKVPADVQLNMLSSLRRTLRRASRWYMRHGVKGADIQTCIDGFLPVLSDLNRNMQRYLVPEEYTQLETTVLDLSNHHVPQQVAYQVASLSNLFPSLDLGQIVAAEQRDIALVARLYFLLGSKLELHWFLEQINKQSVLNHWQAMARAAYREELDWQQRSLTTVILKWDRQGDNADDILARWIAEHEHVLARWYHMMDEFKTSTNHEFAKFSVALRELMLLSLNCD